MTSAFIHGQPTLKRFTYISVVSIGPFHVPIDDDVDKKREEKQTKDLGKHEQICGQMN